MPCVLGAKSGNEKLFAGMEEGPFWQSCLERTAVLSGPVRAAIDRNAEERCPFTLWCRLCTYCWVQDLSTA
jgi:hypothetical protein